MLKKICKLCNRTYSHSYKLFGRGCFNRACERLMIDFPDNIDDKEQYFCDVIARRMGKIGISRTKKYDLAQKYLTLEYLNMIDYGDLSKEKDFIKNEMSNISLIKTAKETLDVLLDNSKLNKDNESFPNITLNKVYRLYKITEKFNKRINSLKYELKKIGYNEEFIDIVEKYLLNDLKFVFDTSKLKIPMCYKVYYAMQVVLWELVISFGKSAGFLLSAELLQKSLIANKDKEEDYYLTNQKILSEFYFNEQLTAIIKKLMKKYSSNKKNIALNEKNIDENELIIVFNKADFYYSLHKATINIEGNKNNDGRWQLKVLIKDKYDFTDPNTTKEDYKDSLLGSVLNNCGVVSQQYGVIRPYNVYIVLNYENFEVSDYEE